MRRYFIILAVLILLFSPSPSFADSGYVLPYPSAMPGSLFYKIDLVKEFVMKYWYYGDFGKFDYSLKESDKYLVEAKTLFEYKQYLLANNSLLKSDSYFNETKPSLVEAASHGKDVKEKTQILKEASLKHIETLEKIRNEVPESFLWNPEKSYPTKLDLWKSIENSIQIRNHIYE